MWLADFRTLQSQSKKILTVEELNAKIKSTKFSPFEILHLHVTDGTSIYISWYGSLVRGFPTGRGLVAYCGLFCVTGGVGRKETFLVVGIARTYYFTKGVIDYEKDDKNH